MRIHLGRSTTLQGRATALSPARWDPPVLMKFTKKFCMMARDPVVLRLPVVDAVGGQVAERVFDLGGVHRAVIDAGLAGLGTHERARAREQIAKHRLATRAGVHVQPLPGAEGDELVHRQIVGDRYDPRCPWRASYTFRSRSACSRNELRTALKVVVPGRLGITEKWHW